jgi:hypothetical protein
MAQRQIRQMRGCAQAHLMQTEDGEYYVVKLANNPQGRRILVNEFLSSLLMKEFGVLTPEVARVVIDPKQLDENRDGTSLPAGVHFGSKYPCPPGNCAIYDFLPSALIPGIYNREHFLGAFVFDKWVSNSDGRQAVFYRAQIQQEMNRGGGRLHWVAQMIDGGNAFQGCDWTFRDSPVQGLYGRPEIYGADVTLKDFEPWLDALMSMEKDILEEAFALLPGEWIVGEERELQFLLDRLYARRERVRDLVVDSLNWLYRSQSQGRAASRRLQSRFSSLLTAGPALLPAAV